MLSYYIVSSLNDVLIHMGRIDCTYATPMHWNVTVNDIHGVGGGNYEQVWCQCESDTLIVLSIRSWNAAASYCDII